MRTPQKIVIWFAAALLIWMGLFPPFQERHVRVGLVKNLDYHFITSPPVRGEIDLMRLLVQWAVVCFAAAGVLWTLKKPTG